jgi:hypothetical protein
MLDPIAEALRPLFERAAKEARETLHGGGTGDFQVLFGHLPKAAISVMGGRRPGPEYVRTFSMTIPSVVGRPDDPDSVVSFVSGTELVHEKAGMERALIHLDSFEKDGPRILANTIRSCISGLLHAGIRPVDLVAAVEASVAASVMNT